ncbi:metal-dependent transcriptional regulator [Natronorubrum texcoconense]|uniref:Mn-dependent transcriptional regulator, DtxR family n=1 Tax=Natronorubrum texcoconense TaxID=1095776 RepID=A0A1G8ZRE1_9EURY|nr:metal-dependent transcriptional regulator [Natronorubrum texcoconense]SDK17669.1 Mn-dependent transcriptional regulator, DtxR family [Natronorubrum texcoconense]
MTGGPQYLLVVFLVERRDGPPVSSGAVADALGRSPAATTEMLQRLESRGLVTYEPYDGATLTDEGRATAAELYEAYETLSRFFRDVLELEEYEREAMELAGAVSPTVIDRLESTLLTVGDSSGETRASLPSALSDSR